MEKQVRFKHGISENGELQVYRIDQIIKNSKVIHETIHPPYSPKDPTNMQDFDPKSIEIIVAISDEKVKTDFAAERQEPLGVGLEEIVKHDRMVKDLGQISVRKITRFYDEGKEISKKYLRSWIMPGDNPSNADVISKALAEKLHTPVVIAAYVTFLASLNT